VGAVQDQIDAVLRARRAKLPLIEREQARWTAIAALLEDLAVALDDVAAVDEEGAAPPVVFDVDGVGLQSIAASALAALATTRARVSRRTVNIGVSGRARNGKSTLLQSLSGLGDEQIPTGKGQPVTAVRSRIFHSDTNRSAQLTMHDGRTFCAEVVGPYFAELKLAPAPRTLADFERFDLADVGEERKRRPEYARLKEMQASLPSYRHLLTGEVRTVDVDRMRQWVAYPEGGAAGAVDERPYLAVRDAVITCRFPVAEVGAVGLIDLPGLGELVPDAEEHHLAGLENDVDFVIVVKRPDQTNAPWKTEDQAGLDLIARAGGAASIRDFMTILINTGGCDEVNIQALRNDLRHRLNEGVDDRNYLVWAADTADRAVVARDVLGRALTHLAVALPRMDAAVIDAALAQCEQAQAELTAEMERLLATVRRISRPTAAEELIARADQVLDELVVSVQDWVAELRVRTGDSYDDAAFVERVEQLEEEIRGWALDGFGSGSAAWVEKAHVRMRRAGASARYSTDALNAIRTEISRRFGGIDDILLRRREEFWRGMAEALRPRLAGLLTGDTGEGALAGLAVALREASDPCPHLAETVETALDVRLDYRTRLLPQMRRVLDGLRPEGIDPQTGAVRAPAVFPDTRDGAADLYLYLNELARKAIYEAAVLLKKETQTMAEALLAYGEQFEDSFIRSETSVPEFRRLVGVYRDELWPEERTGPATATAKVQRVVRLLHAVADAATEKQLEKQA